MNKYLIAVALYAIAAHASARTTYDPAADAKSAVPPTRYISPLADFRAAREPAQSPAATWASSNATVGGQGGMHGMSHDGHAMHKMPAAPAHADHASHAGHGTPAQPRQQEHDGHGQHGAGHSGHDGKEKRQ